MQLLQKVSKRAPLLPFWGRLGRLTPGAIAQTHTGSRFLGSASGRVPVWCYDSSSGSPVPYSLALEWQRDLLARRTSHPSAGRDRPSDPSQSPFPNLVFFLEHPHVFTLGRGASADQLRFVPREIRSPYGDESPPPSPSAPTPGEAGGIDVFRIERGGKITYHGPGQLVVYPIFDLHVFKKDLHWYVETIEDVVIRGLGDLGISAGRAKGYPGVWVDPGSPHERKIAQVGMNVNRWYTMHGFALNVHPDMDYFNKIIPCGIADKEVTSIHQELTRRNGGVAIDALDLWERVVGVMRRRFEEGFGVELVRPTGGGEDEKGWIDPRPFDDTLPTG